MLVFHYLEKYSFNYYTIGSIYLHLILKSKEFTSVSALCGTLVASLVASDTDTGTPSNTYVYGRAEK